MLGRWGYNIIIICLTCVFSFIYRHAISFLPILFYGFYLFLLIFSIYLYIPGLIILSVYSIILFIWYLASAVVSLIISIDFLIHSSCPGRTDIIILSNINFFLFLYFFALPFLSILRVSRCRLCFLFAVFSGVILNCVMIVNALYVTGMFNTDENI